MKLLMDCHSVLDVIYGMDEENSLSFFTQIRVDLHLLFCPRCTRDLEVFRQTAEIMKADFLPPAPELEESLMARVYSETADEEFYDAPAGFSFRSWVIIGFFVLVSLSSAFFGLNFNEIASREGLSFLVPVGVTIGLVLTCYGALFIGSHLKELSSRFGLNRT